MQNKIHGKHTKPHQKRPDSMTEGTLPTESSRDAFVTYSILIEL
ncbi:hypothetical protein [Marinilongibacter aquaticus]|nr:hypothetical protein [Marinilongibacter aquaticus]